VAKAVAWTLLWPIAAFILFAFAILGDCPEDNAARYRACVDHKDIFGWTVVGISAIIYLVGYWQIFRKRGR
jgi:hypothetical protein